MKRGGSLVLITSVKSKMQRLLIANGFTKSTSTKSRIKGLDNISKGFAFKKEWDTFSLYWTCGNGGYRGMPVEEMDKKTTEIYLFLQSAGLEGHIEMVERRNQQAILLK